MTAPALEQVAVLETADGERDRRLALAVRTGDEAAFRELYEAYRDRIWTFIVYSIGDDCQAQDILQTVFLKAFRGLSGFRFRSSLFTWIYRIARNECRNYHRGRGVPPRPSRPSSAAGTRSTGDPACGIPT